MFQNAFDNFFNGRRYLEDPREKITISREKYELLLEKAKKLEALYSEYKEIKAQNQTLIEEIERLKEDGRKLKELEEQNKKYFESLVRAKADLENYKKISDREKQKYTTYALEKILIKLINHYDDLLRAEKIIETIENGDSIKKGFNLLIKNFEKVLAEEKVIPMETEGQIFDPYKHEVKLVRINDDLPENTIVEELNKGYLYNNEVLRPAMVVISKKSKSES
ncbi:MAG: nucleotide exchange factor GrpE [Promethearchaeota archaeon]